MITMLILAGIGVIGYGLVALVMKTKRDVTFENVADDPESCFLAGYVSEEEFEDAGKVDLTYQGRPDQPPYKWH